MGISAYTGTTRAKTISRWIPTEEENSLTKLNYISKDKALPSISTFCLLVSFFLPMIMVVPMVCMTRQMRKHFNKFPALPVPSMLTVTTSTFGISDQTEGDWRLKVACRYICRQKILHTHTDTHTEKQTTHNDTNTDTHAETHTDIH